MNFQIKAFKDWATDDGGGYQFNLYLDGKKFAFENTFAYQLVSADTQVLCFDDVKKYFDFERLFSLVTEGLTLEKKNKDELFLSYSESPKIAFTTNYSIAANAEHAKRRQRVFEFSSKSTVISSGLKLKWCMRPVTESLILS